MPDNKSISQLTTAEQTTSSDLFETAIPNGSLGYLSRKVSLDAIANFIAKALQYSDLQTTAKTLIDAINEAAQSGGGGASIEEMTQAQYDALTPEQKADGTLRAISDATTSINDIDDVNVSSPANGEVLAYDSTSSKWVNSEIEADAVAYDNTSSGLTATDVQAAIDEVNAKDASDIPYSQGVSVADKLDIVNTCKTIYNQTTYQNDIGTARSIGDYDFRDYRVLRINLYVNAISSANRITVVIVNGNANIGASYYPCVLQGNNGNIRIESTNNNITILTSSFGNTICIGDIIGVR